MPRYKKFIAQAPEDFGAALKISGFHVANEAKSAPNQDPLAYDSTKAIFTGGEGISSADISAGNVRVTSGEFFIDDPLISWNLINPADDSVFSPEDVYALTAFSGFNITLNDLNANFNLR